MDAAKLIDVEAALRNKAPAAAQRMPRFVINWLKRLVHEEELNAIVHKYSQLDGVPFMQALVGEFGLTFNIDGEENLPPRGGRYIFASNHPLGGLDGISLAALLGERYDGQIRYLVNDLLLFIPNLQSIFVPVNRLGNQGKERTQRIEAAFASHHQVLTFPAGLCSRRRNGIIEDLEWQPVFVRKAIEHQRDVVPIYFDGSNSAFFYRLANLRARLKIKMNIEMLYLPDEMFKNRHHTFSVRIGHPIPWQTFDKNKTTKQWAQWVKERVYALK